MNETHDGIAGLFECGSSLPDELRERLVREGVAHVDALIQIVEDDELSLEDSRGDGYAPLHAVALLADFGDPRAVEPLVRALARTEWDTLVHDAVLRALPRFGAAALDPVLTAATRASGLDRAGYVEVLAKLGVADERLFEFFRSVFEEDPEIGAMAFAQYGDRRALPMLQRAIENLSPDFDHPFGPRVLIELVAAFRELGGVFPDALRARVDGWFAELAAARAAPVARATARAKVGRNEPCPCGSGKKYKKCCIGVTE